MFPGQDGYTRSLVDSDYKDFEPRIGLAWQAHDRLTLRTGYGISEYLAGSPYHVIVTPYDEGRDPLDPVRYIVETGSADGPVKPAMTKGRSYDCTRYSVFLPAEEDEAMRSSLGSM